MQIIQPLVNRGLAVSLAGGRIKIMPKSLIDDEVRNYIQANREQIYSALMNSNSFEDPLNDLNLLFDDRVFIEGLLSRCRNRNRVPILKQYREKWLEAASNPELKTHQKDNAGRFAANSWIRAHLLH